MARTCTGVVGLNPIGGMAGLHTLVESFRIVNLINCVVVKVIKNIFKKRIKFIYMATLLKYHVYIKVKLNGFDVSQILSLTDDDNFLGKIKEMCIKN